MSFFIFKYWSLVNSPRLYLRLNVSKAEDVGSLLTRGIPLEAIRTPTISKQRIGSKIIAKDIVDAE
jgi:hypothetical protein